MAAVIKRVDSILGIRHWAVWYIYVVPRYEVFRVIGHDTSTGLYYFTSLKNPGVTLSKNFNQLDQHGFHPFCLDWSQVQKFRANNKDPYSGGV